MSGTPPLEDAPEPKREPTAREGEHVAPEFQKPAYHCPYCGVLAAQDWNQLLGRTPSSPGPGYERLNVFMAVCLNCEQRSLWAPSPRGDIVMVLPTATGGPRPHVDMPEDVRRDYEEARSIVGASVRGACGLLRLATEKLVEDLQPDGRDLNDRIGKLVQAGLSPMIQQALDSLRVIGNEAVHPGQLDLRDDLQTATGLFSLVNIIVEDRIARPKHIAEMYAKLPGGKLQGIADRDRPKS